MVASNEDERWGRLVRSQPLGTPASATSSGPEPLAASPGPSDLGRAVAELAAQVGRLTDEVHTIAAVTDKRFEEIRGVIASHITDTAAVASSATELRDAAARLSDQMSRVVARVHDMSEATRAVRAQTDDRIHQIEAKNTAALERFADAVRTLSSELGDTLIQVSARLGAAEGLSRSVSAAMDVLDKPKLDHMAQQIDWLVDVVDRLPRAPDS